MSASTAVIEQELPSSLDALDRILESSVHKLVAGDEALGEAAVKVVKDLFDLGLQLEQISHSHLHPFLIDILQPPSIALRSSTKSKSKSNSSKDKSPTPPSAPEPSSILPYTPLSELTTSGMEPEQIWAQLELRNEGIGAVIKEVGAGSADVEEGDDGDLEEDDSEDGEEGSDEEMTEEEFRRMFADAEMNDSGSSGSGSGSDDDDDEDEEGEDDSEDGGFRLREDMSDEEEEDEEEDNEYEDEKDDEEEDAEDEVNEGLSLDGESGDDDDDDEDDDGMDLDDLANLSEESPNEDDESEEDSLPTPGPSRKSKKKTHPTLDDPFFSIDEFNKLTELAEASNVTSGRLGGGDDDEDDEELDDLGDVMLKAADDDATVMYSDFFDPPKKEYIPASQYKPVKKSKTNVDKKGKGKEKVRFGEDEVLNEDEVDDEEEEEDGMGVMGRVKGDLFDDDEEVEEQLSTHEKRQLALQKQIADLEAQVIGPKDWTLMGEASAKARPENSLLEEDLDFEQVGKVVPVVTEESVKSLEEIIKIRIRDNNFNSPIRVQAYDPTPFLPSRFFELNDKQSTKSLAQIYEDEYQAASSGSKVVDARDAKSRKDHEEIEGLWGEICYKLDALSSLNFVPKQPKAQITTLTNLPTTTLESALPPTTSSSTLLAPEELFAPPSATALVSRSEQTPEENQRQRLKIRKGKKANRDKLGSLVELYGKGKGGGGKKGEKERALEGLVKTGKGVTVVGKGDGKVRKRSRPDPVDGVKEDGKRLKL